MDYQKLADLIYPDLKHTPQELEKLYPERVLPQGALVTRFAPSPTGYLHIGNFFSAFLDWQIARMTNGVFFLRLEDTDKKREIKGSGLVAINILNQFGVLPNEGLMPDGNEVGQYGPYTQSKRLQIYYTYAKELIKQGKAFPCFCDKTESIQEIKEKRQQQLQQESDIEEKDPCRFLTLEQVEKHLKENKPFAIRLKSQGQKGEKIVTHDLIRGERELAKNSKDIILVKNDGIPPYAFAHAVDDHLMGTKVVVRGEEWYVSYPAHLEIFDALGFERLSYIHTPIICKIDEVTGNKRKLSKRKDPEADMRFFLSSGYPTISVVEYLLTLANSNYEMWRLENPNSSYLDFKFTIEKIGNSNPMFDLIKLNDISKNYIAKLTAQEVYYNLINYAYEYDKEFYYTLTKDEAYSLKVLGIDRGGEKPRKDFAKWSDFKDFFAYMFNFVKLENKSDYNLENLNTKYVLEVVENYKEIYSQADDKQEWFNRIKEMSGHLGFATDNKAYKANPESFKGNVADVCNYIRIALTGRQNSPDIHSISQILGENEVKQRLEKLESALK